MTLHHCVLSMHTPDLARICRCHHNDPKRFCSGPYTPQNCLRCFLCRGVRSNFLRGFLGLTWYSRSARRTVSSLHRFFPLNAFFLIIAALISCSGNLRVMFSAALTRASFCLRVIFSFAPRRSAFPTVLRTALEIADLLGVANLFW